MQRLTHTWRLMIGSGMLTCGLGSAAIAQNANPPQRQLILVDPTPRPPDLQREYSNSSIDPKKQQDLQMMKNELRAREVWLDTNKLLLLAQELKAEVSAHENGDSMMAHSMKAREIEKLAKDVKEKMKTH